ncbi:competence type IV pilus minor pilin ComGD [Streptococcaceae bacterium ESL0687]|nr:competence type IV pilus minor pilin ComGD [Streptococcaceae bacterium ESL0687]
MESILTLSAVSLILLLSSTSVTQTLAKIEGELFILKFERIYYDTQFQSMVKRKNESLEIREDKIYYLGKEIRVPDMVSFKKAYRITFSERGGNSSLQKIELSLLLQSKNISYQLYMGSGKYKKTVS